MAKFEILEQVNVHTLAHNYPIFIGKGLLFEKEWLCSFIKAHQALIVTNETIAPLYLDKLCRALLGKQVDTVILPDGENFKNQKSVEQIYDALIQNNHHRDTTIIALGGGVIGDMAAFAASTYQRGVALIQVPTTLLAQVDASVGGKTGINHPSGKNMIGSFYQPNAVIIDLLTLDSLAIREYRAGLAEVIKYALLSGWEFVHKLKRVLNTDKLSSPSLAEVVAQCCRIKADYVEQDEKELGIRALLNLGHTVGHALETITGYKRWLHGEAVAIGLYCAALLSEGMGGINKTTVNIIDQLLSQAGLPRRIPTEIDLQQLQLLMMKDKKIIKNNLRFVLIREVGDCYLDEKVPSELLMKVLQNAKEGD